MRRLLQWVRAALPVAKPTPKKADEPGVLKVVNPLARDRWMSARARTWTPELVETTLRGALSGNLQDQWQLFDLMEETWPRLAKNLNELKRAVVGLEWNLHVYQEEPGKLTPQQKRKKELVEYALWNMRPDVALDESDFEQTMRDLLDAWAKGISVSEVIWEQRVSRLGTIVAPRSTAHVLPRFYGYPNSAAWLGLKVSEDGVKYSQAGAVDGFIRFPADRFLLGVCKAKSGHPLAGALLRPLAWWWCASNFTQSWFLNFAQIFGVPIRWANYDPNKTGLLDEVCDMLENMGSAGWAAFPTGTTLELKEPAKAGADNPQVSLMDRADKQCDLLILGQTLTSDVGASGSRALGEVHSDVRADVIQSAGDWLATVFNTQLIPSICRLNFGNDEDCPYLMPSLKRAKDAKGMAERDVLLLGQGVAMPAAWFYERHDIPRPEADEEVVVGSMGGMGQIGPMGPMNDPAMLQARNGAVMVQARDGQEVLVDRVIEDLSGVEARWLGSLRPYFRGLIVAARNESLTDEQFIRVIEQAQRQFPEMFDQLDHDAVAGALERALGASCMNGALAGAAKRKLPRNKGR